MLQLESEKIDNGKPFVKWVGGKTQLIGAIQEILPVELLKSGEFTYIEPFVGGGAMLFWILNQFRKLKKVVINDINPDLITAYKVVKDSPNDLIGELKEIESIYNGIKTEDERKDFFLIKRELFNKKELSPVLNTSVFIYLNRTCFNGLYRVNSSGFFNVPFGRYSNPRICDERTILIDSMLLQNVQIVSGDYTQTLSYADSKTIFYLDPPYKPLSETSSFNSYSKENFGDLEQLRLKSFCDDIDKKRHTFVLSNSDVKSNDSGNHFFDELYKDYKIKRVMASRMINANALKRGKLTELLITNANNRMNDSLSAVS